MPEISAKQMTEIRRMVWLLRKLKRGLPRVSEGGSLEHYPARYVNQTVGTVLGCAERAGLMGDAHAND